MKKSDVLIVIPAYNEEKNIKSVVDNIVQEYPYYDYIVINDGSKDGTRKVLKENDFNYVNLSINLGIGGAVQTGYKYARDYDYKYAVQVDGDGQHDVAFIGELIKKIEDTNADVVIGSRFIKKEGFQSSYVRRMGISFLSGLIFLCTGKHINDVTSGFRLVSKRYIEIFSEDYPHDFPEPESIVQIVMNKGKIEEVPVIMKERQGGVSSIGFLKSIYYMIKVTLAIIICRVSYGVRR